MRPNHAAIMEQQTIAPEGMSAHMRALLRFYDSGQNNEAIFKTRDYHAIHMRRFEEPLLSEAQTALFLDTWKQQGYEYFAIEYRSERHDSEFNKRVRAEGKRLVEFRPTEGDLLPTYLRSTFLLTSPVHTLFGFDRYGPIVEVYKIANK